MAYIGLGSRMAAAEPDQTGNNTGNWTTSFLAADLGVTVPWFEIHRAVVEQVPPAATAIVAIGNRHSSFTAPLASSEWDPVQPPLIIPGQDVFFYWSAKAAGQPPVTTIWLRYDTEVLHAAQAGYRR